MIRTFPLDFDRRASGVLRWGNGAEPSSEEEPKVVPWFVTGRLLTPRNCLPLETSVHHDGRLGLTFPQRLACF
jgi:hypothetical protein